MNDAADRVRAALSLRRESDPAVEALKIALEALEKLSAGEWASVQGDAERAIRRMADVLEGQ